MEIDAEAHRLSGRQRAQELSRREAAVQRRETAVAMLEGAFVARERAHDARCTSPISVLPSLLSLLQGLQVFPVN